MFCARMKHVNKLILALTLFSSNVYAQVNYPSAAKGLSITSKDTSVKMKVSFRLQSLASYQNNMDGDDSDMKAMIRRMRLKTNGYIFDPKFEYKLEIALSNRDLGNGRDEAQTNNGAKAVLDAVFKYHMNNKNQVWFGQTKLPGNRERVISSMALQFVDRSNVNSKFNIDRDFGVQFRSKQSIGDMPLTLAGAITTGEGRNITVNNEMNGLSYTGRAEFYPFGKFTKKGDYFGADLKREQSQKLAVGVTYCYNQNTTRSGGQLGSFVYELDTLGLPTSDYAFNDISTLFIDLMYKYKGFSVMAEYANKQLKENINAFTHGSGYVAQAGYLFENNYEIAGRYTSVDLAKGAGDLSKTTEYTFCVSKYIVDHKLKVQSDAAFITQEGVSGGDYRIRFQVEVGI